MKRVWWVWKMQNVNFGYEAFENGTICKIKINKYIINI
jgi:hypothetical protein